MAPCTAERVRRDRVIAVSGFAIVVLALYLIVGSWLGNAGDDIVPLTVSSSPLDPVFVDLTLVPDAEKKGAVCLDGSPPGYHLLRGFGSGSDSWIVHLEGGGWCNTVESCSWRTQTSMGSSHYFERQVPFYGILSPFPSLNPDFYNWNKVKVRYCDGASMSGDLRNDVQEKTTKLFFRGKRVWETVMDDLLARGLAKAKQVILTGCSAGGLATFIHCDDFRALLPQETTVKCLPDAGLFLDIEDVSGRRTMRAFYNDAVRLQNASKSLQKDCVSKMEPSRCFFPQEFVKYISTPLFIVNAAYDAWQVGYILTPESSDREGYWRRCRLNIYKCDPKQIKTLQGLRTAMLDVLKEFQHNSNGGMFVNSCFAHCQTNTDITWHSPYSPRINNRTIAEAVGDWYFNRRAAKLIDCAYPCNPTCDNLNFDHAAP